VRARGLDALFVDEHGCPFVVFLWKSRLLLPGRLVIVVGFVPLQSAGFAEGFTQDELDLGVDAPQVVVGPATQPVQDAGVDPQQE